MKNFVREIHCIPVDNCKDASLNDGRKFEVTIVFENEQLRKHKILNGIYERLRLFGYGRKRDIETFCILADQEEKQDSNANGFNFINIYSGNSTLKEDSIHKDPPKSPPHAIRYFAGVHNDPKFNHPVVFINTSNHAMSEHDNNPQLWKWEYIPWLKDSGVICGQEKRKEIDNKYNTLIVSVINILLRILKNLGSA
jgi:hypothetical protein